jgi:FkbM family methyltransferase
MLEASLRKYARRHPRIAATLRPIYRSFRPAGAASRHGAASAAKAPVDPNTRRFRLVLPRHPDGRALPETLLVEVPRPLTVPKKLHVGGLAAYEPESLAVFLAVTDCAPAGAVLDIGANAGVYGLLARSCTKRRVVAFEPVPELAAAAAKVGEDNGLGYPVEQIALGAQDGEAVLYLSDASDSSHSLAEGFRPSSAQLRVPVETLDGWARRTATAPAVLKIDTETTEPDVLRGASDLLTRRRPWILCEVLPGRTEAALMDVIRPYGYSWYLIGDELPLVRRDEIVGNPAHYMWLFTPEPAPERLWERAGLWREALAACLPYRSPASSTTA